jgi:GT2 family glycosyltransferase
MSLELSLIMNLLNKDSLTILVTTFNELNTLKLHLYSFLEFYPELKESIVIFDDNSNDPALREWIDKEGFKRITWKNPDNYISNFEKWVSFTGDHNMSYRNSYMISEIMKEHVNTKYMMINDNDILFLKPGFLEKYDKLLEEGYKAIAVWDHYNYNWFLKMNLKSEMLIKYFLGKYSEFFDIKSETMCRLHWCHGLLDLEYFKEQNLFFDNVKDPVFRRLILNKCLGETGTDFFYEIVKRGIPYYKLTTEVYNRLNTINLLNDFDSILYDPITEKEFDEAEMFHLRWQSSDRQWMNKLKKTQENRSIFSPKIMKDLNNCPKLFEAFKKIAQKYKLDFYDRDTLTNLFNGTTN